LTICSQKLRESDLRVIREHFDRAAGRIDEAIHHQSRNPKFIRVPKEKRPRMPNLERQLEIMRRDGFRCRFCESKVIVKSVHSIFANALPDEARQGTTNETRHFGISNLTASIDHIVPYSRSGTNDPENLVTACPTCNYGRENWLLDEVEIENPFNYQPIVDEWDGLTRLLEKSK